MPKTFPFVEPFALAVIVFLMGAIGVVVYLCNISRNALRDQIDHLRLLVGPDMKDRVKELMQQLEDESAESKNRAQLLKDTTDDLHAMLSSIEAENWPDLKTVEYSADEIEQRNADMAAYVLEQEAADTASRENVRSLLRQFAAYAGFEVPDE